MKPSIELAYWLGVAQSDGYFKEYYEKRGNKLVNRCNVVLSVADKSLPMLDKFKKISKNIIGTSGTFCIDKNNANIFSIRILRFLDKIKPLDLDFSDPPKPPR